MKNIILTFLLLIFSASIIIAQESFIVLKVKGEIILEKTGNKLKPNDEINSNDNLTFKSKDAAVLVNSDSRGRLTIRPVKEDGSEITGILKDAVSSLLSMNKGRLSYKGNSLIENEFWGKYYIVGTYRIKTDKIKFPMGVNHFFFLLVSGEDKSRKITIPYIDDTLMISQDIILKNDMSKSNTYNVKLYYYNKDDNTSSLISDFTLIFVEEKELKSEFNEYLNLINSNLKKGDDEVNDLLDYFYTFYGRTNEENLQRWIRRNISIR